MRCQSSFLLVCGMLGSRVTFRGWHRVSQAEGAGSLSLLSRLRLCPFAGKLSGAFCAAALRRRRHLGVYFSVVYAPLLSLLSLPLTGPAKFSLSDILADSPLEPLV